MTPRLLLCALALAACAPAAQTQPDPQCSPSDAICDGACTSLQTDPAHCGSCSKACSAADSCAQGACVHIDCRTPGVSCGTGTYCSLNDGRCLPGCAQDGQCGDGSHCNLSTHQCDCDSGKHRCDGACVIEDQNSCGDSCAVCAVPGGGASSCPDGVCHAGCLGQTHLCGNSCALNNDVNSCGATSCTPCTTPEHATPTCDGTSCDFTCEVGYSRCGSACVDTTSDDSNCGVCGTTCGYGQRCDTSKCRAYCLGTPAFGAPATLAPAAGLTPVALDEKGDLMLLDGGQILVAPSHNDGGFGTAAAHGGFGSYPTHVVGADVDGDGEVDLVGVAGYLAQPMLEQADGGFAAAGPAENAGSVSRFALGDLDGDGKADIVTIDDGQYGVGAAMGSAEGFGTPQVVPLSTGAFVTHEPVAVALCDFNHDGHLDVAVSDSYSPFIGNNTGEIKILLNDGHGKLGSPVNVFTGSPPGGLLVAGNFSAPGSCDLVYDDHGSLKLLLNSGNANFTASSNSPIFTGTTDAMMAVPFHGKGGTDDLLVESANVLTLYHSQYGTLYAGPAVPGGSLPWLATVGLVDGDLIPDLIVGNGAGGASVLLGSCP